MGAWFLFVRLIQLYSDYCLGGSVAQRLGRRTSDLAVMGSILGPGVIMYLGQLSLPSLRGR